jgi:glutathione S-transferase
MSGQLPLLYSFRRCPYAIRARMALAVSEGRVSLREVVLRDKPEELLAASPKGTVPVLVLPDGKVIEESLEIMEWALLQNDPQRWLAFGNGEDDVETCRDAQTLIAQNDTFFKKHLDGYKYPDQHLKMSASEHREQCEIFLAGLTLRLEKGEFLLGPEVSLADVAIFPFVRQFAQVDREEFDATTDARLRRWLEFFLESILFKAVMIKVAPWVPGDAEIAFPASL